MPTITQDLILNSRDTSANVVTSTNGDSFTVYYQPPIQIPRGASYCAVSLLSANVVHNFDNIKLGVNDKLYFQSYIASVYSAWLSITLDAGLYTISQLNTAIDRKVTALTGVAGSIVLEVEYSTNIIYIVAKTGWKIDFSSARTDSFRELLGFSPGYTGTYAAGGILTSPSDTYYFASDTDSTFGENSSIQLHSSLGKSNYNGRISDILDVFPITSDPGFPTLYQPLHLTKVDASNLVGNEISDLYFRLTNQNGTALIVPDNWNIKVRIEYTL